MITNARLNNRAFDRVRIEFTTSAKTATRTTTSVNTPTRTMKVSTPRDNRPRSRRRPEHDGGLSHFATILGELLRDELLDIQRLASLAKNYPTAVPQRTGWLLERVAEETRAEVDLSPLEAESHARLKPRPLAAVGRQAEPSKEPWNIPVNTDVESDL